MNHQEPSYDAREATQEQGFRAIGNPLTRIGHLRPVLDSTATPSPQSSGTTGVPSPAPRDASSTGRALSATAVEKSRREVGAATDERSSVENLNRFLASLIGSAPDWQSAHKYGPDGQFENEIVAVEFARPLTTEAWAALRPLCEPAAHDAQACRQIAQEVARLFAVTPAARTQGSNDELAADTIAMELAEYPADCALRALRSARLGDRWRPSLSQIIDDVRWRSRRRAVLLDAFRKAGIA